MSGNMMDDLKKEFEAIMNRAEHAVDISVSTFKGMTWDIFIEHKTPSQVKEEIEQLAAKYDEMENRRIG